MTHAYRMHPSTLARDAREACFACEKTPHPSAMPIDGGETVTRGEVESV
jgi:hypothetical protein